MIQRFTSILLVVLAIGSGILACTPGTPPPNLPGLLPYGDRVLEDSFVNNNLGWDAFNSQEGVTGLENESYKIQIKTPFTEIWANPTQDLLIPADVIVEVQALNAGARDNYYGLICRYMDVDNFYFLVVSSDGYYGIGKARDGQHNLIGRTEMPPSELFDGAAVNNLRAECTGNRLALYVNGILLDVQEDTDHAQGRAGLIAGSYAEEVSVYFDNFRVFTPRP